MNTPEHYAMTAEIDQNSQVYALLAMAAAINRLADAVSEAGSPPTYRRPT
jgi:hypothetical protein